MKNYAYSLYIILYFKNAQLESSVLYIRYDSQDSCKWNEFFVLEF